MTNDEGLLGLAFGRFHSSLAHSDFVILRRVFVSWWLAFPTAQATTQFYPENLAEVLPIGLKISPYSLFRRLHVAQTA
jgi:hypothetical protein